MKNLQDKIKSGEIKSVYEEMLCALYIIIALLAYQSDVRWLMWLAIVIAAKNFVTAWLVAFVSSTMKGELK